MKILNKKEIDYITIGASILASGGGGDPYIGNLMALQALEKCGPIQLISVDELHKDAFIISTGMIGAPTVMIEKIPRGDEAIAACRLIENILGKKISAIYPIEAGGINSLLPLTTATHLGIPVVDVDGMGRAFPEFQMTTFYVEDINASPFVVTDEKSNTVLIQATDSYTTERLARSVCAKMGGSACFAGYAVTAEVAKKSGILDILSFEYKIGQTVEWAQNNKLSVVKVLLDLLNGFTLFQGKIIKIDRKVDGGFVHGMVSFDGIEADQRQSFTISFQNEYLLAQSKDKILCTTPDLIIVLDIETGMPILTERLRYGLRVVVIGVPAHKKWRTKRGIEVVGPRYFKYDVDFVPVEALLTMK
ncbi:MAG: DUF917 domain-containing protein [Candidatus Rickettsia vulgarisii]